LLPAPKSDHSTTLAFARSSTFLAISGVVAYLTALVFLDHGIGSPFDLYGLSESRASFKASKTA
jgi:hypothetical protein